MDSDLSLNTAIPTGNASRGSRQQRSGLQAIIYQLQSASFPEVVTSANHCLTQEPPSGPGRWLLLSPPLGRQEASLPLMSSDIRGRARRKTQDSLSSPTGRLSDGLLHGIFLDGRGRGARVTIPDDFCIATLS